MRKLLRLWRVWRGTQCWKCNSRNLTAAAGSVPEIMTITCDDCGMFLVKQS